MSKLTITERLSLLEKNATSVSSCNEELVVNNADKISTLQLEIEQLKQDVQDFKNNIVEEHKQLRSELLSHIIMSNAMKEIDVEKLTTAATSLSEKITSTS